MGKHKIKLVEWAIRRKTHVYKILETYKLKVDEQLKELLALNLDDLSDAEILYLVVCFEKRRMAHTLMC